MSDRKIFLIKHCGVCPNFQARRNFGQDIEWTCRATGKLLWNSFDKNQKPPEIGEFPDWCPLFTAEPGMFE